MVGAEQNALGLGTNSIEHIRQSILAHLQKHPVRKEQTHERNLEMSEWIRNNCRQSTGTIKVGNTVIGPMVVTDVDFLFHCYNDKRFQLVEVKTLNGCISFSQRQSLDVLDEACQAGAQRAGYIYHGLHRLRMTGTTPDNSEYIAWDGQPVTPQICWARLNMLDEVKQ
jgi:hypothetical protein